jgi:putative transposase
MYPYPPLLPDRYYHIYNCGIDHCDIFSAERNYSYFLKLYEKYIDPIADTFAFCLLKNHFHFLIRIKSHECDPFDFESERQLSINIEFVSRKASKAFSNMFNAYTQAYNKSNDRSGTLFETPFKRIEVNRQDYFKHLVYYIHNNPVKHGFTNNMFDYPWSSYLTIVTCKPTRICRKELIGWFDSFGNFKEFHETKQIIPLTEIFKLDIDQEKNHRYKNPDRVITLSGFPKR